MAYRDPPYSAPGNFQKMLVKAIYNDYLFKLLIQAIDEDESMQTQVQSLGIVMDNFETHRKPALL